MNEEQLKRIENSLFPPVVIDDDGRLVGYIDADDKFRPITIKMPERKPSLFTRIKLWLIDYLEGL